MLENILQLIVVLVVFVLVLFAAFYSSKWIAKNGGMQMKSANIKAIETYKIAPNKYIQIVRIGSKYYSIGITKDQITYLTELDEEQLDLSKMGSANTDIHFKDILKNFTNKDNKQK